MRWSTTSCRRARMTAASRRWRSGTTSSPICCAGCSSASRTACSGRSSWNRPPAAWVRRPAWMTFACRPAFPVARVRPPSACSMSSASSTFTSVASTPASRSRRTRGSLVCSVSHRARGKRRATRRSTRPPIPAARARRSTARAASRACSGRGGAGRCPRRHRPSARGARR